MSFQLDFSKISNTSVADGDYEAVISNVNEDANANGTEFVNFDMVIRNDVTEQKFQNAHVFHRIYRNKQTNEFPQGMIFQVAKAAGMQDGKKYNSFEDFMNDMIGKPVKLRVKNESSEYQGKTYQNLNVKRWGKTQYPIVAHKWPAGMEPKAVSADKPSIEISDDDIPF